MDDVLKYKASNYNPWYDKAARGLMKGAKGAKDLFKVEDEDVEKLQTVKDVVEYISKRLNNSSDNDEGDEYLFDEVVEEEYLDDTEDDEEDFI